MEIGKIREFTVLSKTDAGHRVRLVAHEGEEAQELFMPTLRTDPLRSHDLEIDQTIEAFVHLDDDGKLCASLLLPTVEVEEFAVLRVVESQHFGAFLQWGLEKDLFVPAKKQKSPMQVGELHLVRVCYDTETGKIYGTTKYESMLETLDFYFTEGEKVELIAAEEHELGYRCIINRKFIGMIYHNEIFTDIELDKQYVGYVKKIREDGLIDAALQIQGAKALDSFQTKVMELLEASGGKSHLHDKSSPEDIKRALGMSKKAFKSAIGMLYKARKIAITDSGIELVKKP
tara:strand:- start:38834 stop:39697 length:864 start_codon:yes stop_codon:yes gene_type:complete